MGLLQGMSTSKGYWLSQDGFKNGALDVGLHGGLPQSASVSVPCLFGASPHNFIEIIGILT